MLKIITVIIISIIGIVCAYGLNSLEAETFASVIPICWIPRIECIKLYPNMKLYILVLVMVFCVWIIPF